MTEKLKVVIACDTFPPDINGAARFAERLAAGLSRHGNEVHVLASATGPDHGTRTEFFENSPVIVHRLRSYKLLQHKTLRYVWPIGLRRHIEQILREVKPIALHIQSHLIVGRFAVKAARKTGVKLIATNHIMPENLIKYSFVPTWLQKPAMNLAWKDAGRILRKMDAVTTPTKRAAELLERAAGVTGVLAISCGIDAARFANQVPTSNLNPIFLFLGRLDDEKRIHILLRAVAKLTEFPKVRVELVGDGGERENLERLARELGIAERVAFLGHVSDKDLPAAYERCTAFVMPSIAELQSIATMEAMASGRPVIGADAMALPHLIHDGDNGYLFPPDDVDALSDRLRRVLVADQAELDRMSENSLHLIQAHDIERTITIFEDLYRGVGESAPTTSDNEPSYLLPIGSLSEALREAQLRWREERVALRKRAESVRSGIRELFEEAREEAREQLEEFKEDVRDLAEEVTERTKRIVRRRHGDENADDRNDRQGHD